jgi:hypothetical protein
MDPRSATIVPSRTQSPHGARTLLAAEGAALVGGITGLDHAVRVATEVLGETCVRVVPQIDVTRANQDAANAKIADKPVDDRGRRRVYNRADEALVAHNDGFGFGDLAPDLIFLYSERPCSIGGDSFLIDALSLLAAMSADDDGFAEFAWTVAVDHTEPGFPVRHAAPIARMVGGRPQVRCQPFLAAIPGPHVEEHSAYVTRWLAAVDEARLHGARFHLEAGEMACVDNFRVLHGRAPYVDDARRLHSVWGWSTNAVAVPEHVLSIVEPEVAGV